MGDARDRATPTSVPPPTTGRAQREPFASAARPRHAPASAPAGAPARSRRRDDAWTTRARVPAPCDTRSGPARRPPGDGTPRSPHRTFWTEEARRRTRRECGACLPGAARRVRLARWPAALRSGDSVSPGAFLECEHLAIPADGFVVTSDLVGQTGEVEQRFAVTRVTRDPTFQLGDRLPGLAALGQREHAVIERLTLGRAPIAARAIFVGAEQSRVLATPGGVLRGEPAVVLGRRRDRAVGAGSDRLATRWREHEHRSLRRRTELVVRVRGTCRQNDDAEAEQQGVAVADHAEARVASRSPSPPITMPRPPSTRNSSGAREAPENRVLSASIRRPRSV